MNELNQKWIGESIWWLATLVLVTLILSPIYISGVQYKFTYYNIIFGIAGLTIFRYLVLFDQSPFSESRVFKVLFIFAVPILFFPIIEGLHDFLEYNDREGLQNGMEHLSLSKQNFLIKYIRIEYLGLGLTCMIGAILMIAKMVRSLWRQYKYQEA